MDHKNFDKLLLRTAFSCMACDGNIDRREVKLIKKLHKESKIFGDININSELDNLLLEINKDGQQFLRDYFSELKGFELSESKELKIIEIAISTIQADDKVEYSEIKFFKVIRSQLKIENDLILEKHPDFENYLEEDIISESYLASLQEEFFDSHISNGFKIESEIDHATITILKEEDKI